MFDKEIFITVESSLLTYIFSMHFDLYFVPVQLYSWYSSRKALTLGEILSSYYNINSSILFLSNAHTHTNIRLC